MNNKKRLDCGLTIKSVNDETGEFTGYGSIFGNKDSYSDIVEKGAFEKSLASWRERGRLPAMLWQHNMSEPIGVYTKIIEDENGLYVEGRLLINDDPLAKRAHAHMKAGSLTGFSIGYSLVDYEYDKGKEAYLLKEIDLWEVSLVTFPANDQARLSEVKSAFKRGETPSPKIVEKSLRDVGFSQSQAKAFMSKGYSGINQRDVDTTLISSEIEKLTQKLMKPSE